MCGKLISITNSTVRRSLASAAVSASLKCISEYNIRLNKTKVLRQRRASLSTSRPATISVWSRNLRATQRYSRLSPVCARGTAVAPLFCVRPLSSSRHITTNLHCQVGHLLPVSSPHEAERCVYTPIHRRRVQRAVSIRRANRPCCLGHSTCAARHVRSGCTRGVVLPWRRPISRHRATCRRTRHV